MSVCTVIWPQYDLLLWLELRDYFFASRGGTACLYGDILFTSILPWSFSLKCKNPYWSVRSQFHKAPLTVRTTYILLKSHPGIGVNSKYTNFPTLVCFCIICSFDFILVAVTLVCSFWPSNRRQLFFYWKIRYDSGGSIGNVDKVEPILRPPQ